MFGIGNLLTVAGCDQAGNSSINPNRFVNFGQGLNGQVVYQQGNSPASRGFELHRDGRRFSTFRQSPAPVNRQGFRALRQVNPSILELEGRLGELSRTAIALLFEVRILRPTGKEVAECGLQMSQSLLQRNTAHFIEKRQTFIPLPSRQHCRRLVVANPLLSLIPRFCSGCESTVIDQSHATKSSPQQGFLPWSWIKAEFEGAFYHASHSNILSVRLDGFIGERSSPTNPSNS